MNRVTGGVRVGIGADVQIEELRDRLHDVVEARSLAIYMAARARWPVRTGRSRDAIIAEDISAGPRVAYRVGNESPAARFIRSTKIGRERGATRLRYALTVELGNPVRAAKKELPREIAPIVREVLERGDG